jgi:hypothetical protein
MSTLLLALAPAFAGDVICSGLIGADDIDVNVVVQGSCILDGTTIDGNVTIENGGSLLAIDAFVGGSIQTDDAKRVRVKQSEVIGDIQLTGVDGLRKSEVTDTFVGGTVDVHHSDAAFTISRNEIDSDLKANDNTGGVTIVKNVVGGNLQCQGNDPAPIGGFNVVDGTKEDQCELL